jgi:protein-tyrosine phosphatase
MIDLHNHILPSFDDGASNLGEALLMVRHASSCGTRTMAATPHRFFGGKESTAEIVEKKVAELNAEIKRAGINLSVVPGTELQMTPDIVPLLRSGQLMPVGGRNSKAVLIEPPFDAIPQFAISLLKEVIRNGYRPILAHPERNTVSQSNLSFVSACANLQICIQLTSGSILGQFGRAAEETSRRICEHRDWTIIIASDSHDPYTRSPDLMTQARDTVAEWTGDEEFALNMVTTTPSSLIGIG